MESYYVVFYEIKIAGAYDFDIYLQLDREDTLISKFFGVESINVIVQLEKENNINTFIFHYCFRLSSKVVRNWFCLLSTKVLNSTSSYL